ncbi:MAG: protein kinase [Thermodesulfobacteriota bacterium]
MKTIIERMIGIGRAVDNPGEVALKGTRINGASKTSSAPEPLKAGTVLRDRYKVKDFLYWDGRHNHYVVTDIEGKRIYELREFPNDQGMEVEREIITKRLKHWGIVRRYNLFTEDNRTYIVSDYHRAPDLENTRRFLSTRDILGIAFTLVDTLHYLHSHGIAQVDLSARNIKDMKEVQKIVEFSSCRLFSGPSIKGFREARKKDFLGLVDLLERLILRIIEQSEAPSLLHLIKSLEEMVATPPISAADFKERLSQCNTMETNMR